MSESLDINNIQSPYPSVPSVCPVCDSGDTYHIQSEIFGMEEVSTMACRTCDGRWTDKLVSTLHGRTLDSAELHTYEVKVSFTVKAYTMTGAYTLAEYNLTGDRALQLLAPECVRLRRHNT